MKKLQDILYRVPLREFAGPVGGVVSGLSMDSRQVSEGMLFAAVRGTRSDGHLFISQAIAAGARTVLCEEIPGTREEGVAYLRVTDSALSLAIIAANFYDNPSEKLKLVGITGTNGKTTGATLLYKLFTELGHRCGLLSTVGNIIGDSPQPATHTTPDTIHLNAMLAQMVEKGCDYAFMEVSSHAIAQQRITGLAFAGGIFTNISHDHLDYHKTFETYLKVKKSFFDGLPPHAFALSNADDKRGMVMLQNTKAHRKTYSLQKVADFRAKLVEDHFSGMLLHIDGEEVWFRLLGRFNAYNLLSVYAAAMLLDQDKLKVLTILSRLQGAEGRFDCLTAPNGVIGIVDYAHTPDALQNVLETIHELRANDEQVITVIGCGGDRDKAKRPLMAQVACDWSDKVILTADNPRSEDPDAIIGDMQKGVSPANSRKVLAVANRREAIKTSWHLAGPGDIILIAGKGHEKYQEIRGERFPFDDKEELINLFEDTGQERPLP